MVAPHRDLALKQVANAEFHTNRSRVGISPLIAAGGLVRDDAELAEAGQHVAEVVRHHIRDQGARLLAAAGERQYGNRDQPTLPPKRRLISGPRRQRRGSPGQASGCLERLSWVGGVRDLGREILLATLFKD